VIKHRPWLQGALALAACLTLWGCPLRWVVMEDPGGEGDRVHILVQRHRSQLERAVTYMNDDKVSIPIRETRLLNFLGFEIARQQPVLAVYTNGKEVGNNLTRFQRAVSSMGDDADKVLRALLRAGLLEDNAGYKLVKLGLFYRVKDTIMVSEIGGALTTEPETATFYFPLPPAKAFAQRKVALKDLIARSIVVGDGEQAIGTQF
jgi:hypothetical protein